MLNVFFTVDVEVWCDGWENIDAEFPEAFRQYVYGPTPQGNYALPYQLKLLRDHGLTGVFFVEPLFSTRFGSDPLAEIVALVRDAEQDVQLHLHTEWVDESRVPLLPNVTRKRQNLRDFSVDEQRALLGAGKEFLRKAGATNITAFRAGNFGFNLDTLGALADNGLAYDSSYNASLFGPDSGVMPGAMVFDTLKLQSVYEVPMTVFRDGTGLRHAQLTACSYRELEGLLWQALEEQRRSFVILSHNFELLDPSRTHADRVVVERFRKLCALLDRNRDSFTVRGFPGFKPDPLESQPSPLTSPIWRTGARMLEQAFRRRYA